MPRVALGLALLVALVAAGPPVDQDPLQQVRERPLEEVEVSDAWIARLNAIFDDGVLKNEFKHDMPVTRWPGPGLSIAVRGGAAEALWPHLELVVADLSAASGLAIELLDQSDAVGDIQVVLSNRPSYWPMFAAPADPADTRFTCIALPFARDGTLERAEIHINVANVGPVVARACLLEELLQSLGLFGEVEDLATALNDDIGYQRLGSADRILLATLYDSELAPGLRGEAARQAAHQIIARRVAAIGR